MRALGSVDGRRFEERVAVEQVPEDVVLDGEIPPGARRPVPPHGVKRKIERIRERAGDNRDEPGVASERGGRARCPIAALAQALELPRDGGKGSETLRDISAKRERHAERD